MASTFHPGELAVQRRAGVLDQAAGLAGMLAEQEVPGGAVAFLEAQPFLVLGHQDDAGDVWASVLHGAPGFVRVLDARTLVLDAAPAPGDALETALGPAPRPLGLLAIEPASRQRLRLNGTATADGAGRIVVTTESVYGNCPKYIAAREPEDAAHDAVAPGPAVRSTALDAAQRALVEGADAFFVASVHRRAGADVSHRGGRPGFVRVDPAGTRLSWPDYSGNKMFNTLGNLELDPRAGLLFANWATGDALQVRGRARVDWEPERAATWPRAERVLDLEVEEVVALPGRARRPVAPRQTLEGQPPGGLTGPGLRSGCPRGGTSARARARWAARGPSWP